MTLEERELLSREPIEWTGDLSDDCTAKWAGLMLRAESMNDNHWWWAVYDMQRDETTIDSSNEYNKSFVGGEIARKKAESVAIIYISILTSGVVAKYSIADTFKITGRGIVFAGYISEGTISVDDTIEFTAFGTLRQRRIRGVEGIRKSQPEQVNTGLLIECKSPHEIDELWSWKPDGSEAIVYKNKTIVK